MPRCIAARVWHETGDGLVVGGLPCEAVELLAAYLDESPQKQCLDRVKGIPSWMEGGSWKDCVTLYGSLNQSLIRVRTFKRHQLSIVLP
jgi:hypothetical protein